MWSSKKWQVSESAAAARRGADHGRVTLARTAIAVLVVSLAGLLAGGVATRAGGADPTFCQRHEAASVARAAKVSADANTDRRVLVIGDSWSVGLGLRRPEESWPSRLPGQVRVAGFSGSGFSATASSCPQTSYADRARGALGDGADLVVLEGGLNDFDQTDAAIRAGVRRVLRELQGERVVIVGPASAPDRASAVPRVNALLARLAERAGVPYLDATGFELTYLADGLHLTPTGHRAFGDAVAAALLG